MFSYGYINKSEPLILLCKENMLYSLCKKSLNYFKSLNLMIIITFRTKFEYKYDMLQSTQPYRILFFHIDVYYRKIFFDFKELDIFEKPTLFIH